MDDIAVVQVDERRQHLSDVQRRAPLGERLVRLQERVEFAFRGKLEHHEDTRIVVGPAEEAKDYTSIREGFLTLIQFILFESTSIEGFETLQSVYNLYRGPAVEPCSPQELVEFAKRGIQRHREVRFAMAAAEDANDHTITVGGSC